jgi:hypothetical protein
VKPAYRENNFVSAELSEARDWVKGELLCLAGEGITYS